MKTSNLIKVYILCPYCGNKNTFRIDPSSLRRSRVELCSVHSGGCGEDFVFKYRLQVELATYKLNEMPGTISILENSVVDGEEKK